MKNENLPALLGLSSDDQDVSLYRVLYCLQIIQSLVFEYK